MPGLLIDGLNEDIIYREFKFLERLSSIPLTFWDMVEQEKQTSLVWPASDQSLVSDDAIDFW